MRIRCTSATRPVRLRLARVEKLVGQFIAPERIRQILTDLDILISEEMRSKK